MLCLEIAADAAGIHEFEEQEHRLNQKKLVLEKRLHSNQSWAANFDDNIGGLTGHHGNLVKTTRLNYIEAKKRHGIGIQCLKDEFGFHPEFARAGDGFQTKSSYICAQA